MYFRENCAHSLKIAFLVKTLDFWERGAIENVWWSKVGSGKWYKKFSDYRRSLC